MAIEFECPECEKTIRVKESAAGKTGRCPKCRVLLLIPDPADWEDEDADDELPGEDRGIQDQETVAESGSSPSPEVPREPPPARSPTGERNEPDVIATEPSVIPPLVEPTSGVDSALDDSDLRQPQPGQGPPTVGSDADTIVSQSSGILDKNDDDPVGTDPAPTEEFQAPWQTDPVRSSLPGESGSAAALARVRPRRSRRQPMPTSRRIAIIAAVCAMVLLVGVGWWLYARTLPDLSRTIAGQRLPRATFDEVFASIPGNVSGEVVDKVLADIGSGGYSLNSGLMKVDLYPASGELEIAIEPTSKTVAVRVPLASDRDIREAMREVEDLISEVQTKEREAATAAFFEDYAAFLENGSPIESLGDYRDSIALNAAVGTVGYAVAAIVPRRAPLLCVYQDAEGYCYFFIPKGIDEFRIRGRNLLGENEEPPLPVDFIVTVKEGEEFIEVSRTPEEAKASDEETSEETKSQSKEESETGDENSKKTDSGNNKSGTMSAGDESKAMMTTEDGKPAGEMKKSVE